MQFTYLLSIAVALVTVSALPANSSTTADSSTFTTAYNNIVLAHPGITPTDATSATWGFLDAVNVVNSTTTLVGQLSQMNTHLMNRGPHN